MGGDWTRRHQMQNPRRVGTDAGVPAPSVCSIRGCQVTVDWPVASAQRRFCSGHLADWRTQREGWQS